MKKLLHNQQGSVFVISMFILVIMTTVALVLTRVVILSILLSTNLDNAALAYYGAESGIEKGLYESRKLDKTIAVGDEQDLGNEVMWTRDIDYLTEALSFKKVERNKSVYIDLFDPDYPLCNGPDIECTIESMLLSWSEAGTVFVSYSEWDVASEIVWEPTEQTEKKFQSNVSNLIINDFSPNKNYRVKIKALFEDLNDLTITTYDQDNAQGSIVPIPNYLTIVGKGRYRTAKQAIEVQIPRNATLSSLFDYVIFSEESLIKEL